jgi:hypothetical protein
MENRIQGGKDWTFSNVKVCERIAESELRSSLKISMIPLKYPKSIFRDHFRLHFEAQGDFGRPARSLGSGPELLAVSSSMMCATWRQLSLTLVMTYESQGKEYRIV